MKKNIGFLILFGLVGAVGLGSLTYHYTNAPQKISRSENQEIESFIQSQKGKDFYRSIQSQVKANEKMVGLSIPKYEGEVTPERIERSLCISDELEFQKIERDIIDSWNLAWRKGELERFKQIFNDDNVEFIDLSNPKLALNREFDNIQQYNWSGYQKLTGRSEALNSASRYLKSFKELKHFDLNVYQYRVSPTERNYEDMSFDKATLLASFDTRGIKKEGDRHQDRGKLKIHVVKNDNEWRVQSVDLNSAESLVANRAPAFSNITKSSGLSEIPIHLRREAIRRGGYALSVSDYNSDGHYDLFVGAMGKSTAWLGNGRGKFKRDTESAFVGETLMKSAIFADFNNDGLDDLVSTRFTFEETKGVLHLYKNTPDGFKRWDSNLDEKLLDSYAMPATSADFNGDGLLDLYVGFPGRLDFTQAVPVVNEKRKTYQGLYMNSENGNFEEANSRLVVDKNVYPHASIAVDYDSDGDMDIMVIDDRNNLSPMYQNDGKGMYHQVAEKVGLGNRAYGMGVDFSDINNDGNLDAFVSNVNLPTNKRISNSCASNFALNHSPLKPHKGFRYFASDEESQFTEKTREVGLDEVGEGAAGFATFDYNNDGLQDIYVTNGLWSAGDGTEDLSSIMTFNTMIGPKGLKDRARGTERTEDQELGVLSSLIEEKGSLKGLDKEKRYSLAGYQRNKLFRNNGDGSFTEVGFIEGVDSIADGYMVAIADLNHDGKQDLVLRNADPGLKSYQFPPVEVFENNSKDQNNFLRLGLRGVDSNTNGIGARIYVEAGDKRLYEQILANNGAVQSERVAHFGLGDHKVAEKVTVKWPSGQVEVYENLKAGSYVIKDKKIRTLASD